MGDPVGALIVQFTDFDVDFFMNFRERNVLLFTARSDVAIPIDLGTSDTDAIIPVIGDNDQRVYQHSHYQPRPIGRAQRRSGRQVRSHRRPQRQHPCRRHRRV